MNHTIEFIRKLLSAIPDQNLMENYADDLERLDLVDSIDDLEFQTMEESDASFDAAAVDGGQGTVVRNNVFNAGVYRAGYVHFRDRNRVAEFGTPLNLVNLTRANYSGIFKKAYRKAYGCLPERYPKFSETLGRLRRIAEEKCFEQALDRLHPGDILLLDGSLRADPGNESAFLSLFLKEAKKREIDIVAVTKTSSLLWMGGANAIAVIKKEGDRNHRNKSWYVHIVKNYNPEGEKWLGKIYIARLNGFSDLTFRVDLSSYNVSSPAKVFAKLSTLSDDPFFLGYPYPLAAVHQMVRLSEDELLGFSLRLKYLAMEAGIDENGWGMLFADYHGTLNYDLKESRLRL